MIIHVQTVFHFFCHIDIHLAKSDLRPTRPLSLGMVNKRRTDTDVHGEYVEGRLVGSRAIAES